MPDITSSGGGAQTIPADADLLTSPGHMDEESFDELMQGLPETQKSISLSRIADYENAAEKRTGSLRDVPAGRVMLTNLRFPSEQIFVPESDPETGREYFVGDRTLQFVDGRIIVTEQEAAYIKGICPYVYEEPANGQVFLWTADGFETRSPEAFQEYARIWAEKNT